MTNLEFWSLVFPSAAGNRDLTRGGLCRQPHSLEEAFLRAKSHRNELCPQQTLTNSLLLHAEFFG